MKDWTTVCPEQNTTQLSIGTKDYIKEFKPKPKSDCFLRCVCACVHRRALPCHDISQMRYFWRTDCSLTV